MWIWLLLLIALIVVLWLCRKRQPKTTYNITDYPAIHYIHDMFQQNHASVEHYTKLMRTKPLNPIKREEGVWSGPAADSFVKSLPDSWILGWSEDDNWTNYLICYQHQLATTGIVSDIIQPVLDIVNVCGLSHLSPHATIKPHVDADTTIKAGRLTYHYNVYGSGSEITINDKTSQQVPGASLVFDSGFTHSVINGPECRLLIYLDFDVRAASNYVYADITNQIDRQSFDVRPTKPYTGGVKHYIYGSGYMVDSVLTFDHAVDTIGDKILVRKS